MNATPLKTPLTMEDSIVTQTTSVPHIPSDPIRKSDHEILEVTDYYENRGTEPRDHETESSYSDDTYDSSIDNVSDDFSDLELAIREKDFTPVPHQIEPTYSTSEDSLGDVDIDTMESLHESDDDILEVTDYCMNQNTEYDDGKTQSYYSHNSHNDVLDNVSANFSDLELAVHDQELTRMPCEIRRMYFSSEESFGNTDSQSMEPNLELGDEIREATDAYKNSDIENSDEDTGSFPSNESEGDRSFDSLSADFSDLELVRRDEFFMQIHGDIKRTYSNSLAAEPQASETTATESIAAEGVETANGDDDTPDNTTSDEEPESDAVKGAYVPTDSTCERCGNPNKVQHSLWKKHNVINKLGRMIGRCFGCPSRRCQECNAKR